MRISKNRVTILSAAVAAIFSSSRLPFYLTATFAAAVRQDGFLLNLHHRATENKKAAVARKLAQEPQQGFACRGMQGVRHDRKR